MFKIPSINSNTLNASSITKLTSPSGNLTTNTWAISEECSKIKAGNAVYVLSASGTYDLLTNPTALTWVAFDSTMTYGLGSNKIYKYSSSGMTYVPVSSGINSAFVDGTVIQSYSNRIIAYIIEPTSIIIEAYIDNNNNLTRLTSKVLNFTSKPAISISSQLTKVLIYGVNNGSLNTYLYFINYTNLVLSTLTFPV